ncbi:MAG: VOC family protein [Pseudomonadota bacterium]
MALLSSVPVLRVSAYPAARTFWTEVLQFDVVEEAGEPITGFGIFRRDAATVFLMAWDGPEAPYDRWRAYFHTDAVEALAARLRDAGCNFRGPVATEYRMREIEVTDPDGNVLCFGQDVP